jgi:hypothetical protein
MSWLWYDNGKWKMFEYELSHTIEFHFNNGIPSFDLSEDTTVFLQETFVVFHITKSRHAISRIKHFSHEKAPWGYIDDATGEFVIFESSDRYTITDIKQKKLFSTFCFYNHMFPRKYKQRHCNETFIINFDSSLIVFASGKTAALVQFQGESCSKRLSEEEEDFDSLCEESDEDSDDDEEEDEKSDEYTFDSKEGFFSLHHIKIKKADASLTTCSICYDKNSEEHPLIELRQCQNHAFHYKCLQTWFQEKPICPVCRQSFGLVFGNQPLNGTMKVSLLPYSLPGFLHYATIQIDYHFPASFQEQCHPTPGAPLEEDSRRAFLPNNDTGKKILSLLQVAWQRRLIFTVGVSLTHGPSGGERIVWNGIHHKTNIAGAHGYPDNSYFSLVLQELASVNIS